MPRLDDPQKLADFALFGGLNLGVLQFLAERLQTLVYPAKQWVFRKGEAGRAVYVIVEGSVELRYGSADAAVTETRWAGQCFGELSVVDFQPREADAEVIPGTCLLELKSSDLDALYRHDVRAYCLVILNLARELARQVRHR